MPLFSESDSRRIVRAIRDQEQAPKNPTPTLPASGGRSAPDIQVIRVTSTTPTSGRYPAKVQRYDSSANTWSDLGDCWAVEPNGVALTAVRYLGRRAGPYSNSPVFIVDKLTVDTDVLVKVSSDDTTADYLGAKIEVTNAAGAASLYLSESEQSGGGNERLRITCADTVLIFSMECLALFRGL